MHRLGQLRDFHRTVVALERRDPVRPVTARERAEGSDARGAERADHWRLGLAPEPVRALTGEVGREFDGGISLIVAGDEFQLKRPALELQDDLPGVRPVNPRGEVHPGVRLRRRAPAVGALGEIDVGVHREVGRRVQVQARHGPVAEARHAGHVLRQTGQQALRRWRRDRQEHRRIEIAGHQGARRAHRLVMLLEAVGREAARAHHPPHSPIVAGHLEVIAGIPDDAALAGRHRQLPRARHAHHRIRPRPFLAQRRRHPAVLVHMRPVVHRDFARAMSLGTSSVATVFVATLVWRVMT